MDMLRTGLVELAKDAPTGGAPAAELWARGRRAQRLRVAALAAALLVVGTIGAGIGLRLASEDGTRSDLGPAATVDVALPIDYPTGQDLPQLTRTPGPLAAIWWSPRDGGTPEVVGLVAETGTFGTLPIDLSHESYEAPDAYLALSPDGRRLAYLTPSAELTVLDLTSGETYSPAPADGTRAAFTWTDATHLVGHVAGGSDVDGWVWEPGGTTSPVDLRTYPGSPYLGPHAGNDPWFLTLLPNGNPQRCLSLQGDGEESRIPVLCDVLGVIGPKVALTHDGDGSVIATDVQGVGDSALREEVVLAGAPRRVVFATDLVGAALAEGGAS